MAVRNPKRDKVSARMEVQRRLVFLKSIAMKDKNAFANIALVRQLRTEIMAQMLSQRTSRLTPATLRLGYGYKGWKDGDDWL